MYFMYFSEYGRQQDKKEYSSDDDDDSIIESLNYSI